MCFLILRVALAAAIPILGAVPASATLVTYEFSGVYDENSSLPPIADGTPFNGTFTLDTSAPGMTVGSMEEYPQPRPPANLTLHIAGLTMQSTADGLVRIGSSTKVKFNYFFGTSSFTGAGWSYTPTAPATSVENTFTTLYDLAFGTDLANLPTLTAPGIHFVGLMPGVYTFPGGTATLPDSEFLSLPVSEVTLVPEPSSFALAALAVAGLLACRRRLRSGD